MHQPAVPVPDFSAALDRIRAWAKANDWKPAALAREADVADNVTRGMGEDDWAPSGSSVRKLEAIIPDGWRSGDPLPVGKPPKRAPRAPSIRAAAGRRRAA